ncbi:MAG: transcriptional regulator [Halobacteriovoraceae bacterium]|nr:transcriptional regulator [Halobacteriovoraceae bacterium]
MTENDIFSIRLKELRERKNWSQAEMARNAGITPAAANQFEKGTRKPNLPILQKLASVLEVSIDFLVGKSDEENEYKVNSEWEEFYRGFKELSEQDREILKEQMEFFKHRSKVNE